MITLLALNRAVSDLRPKRGFRVEAGGKVSAYRSERSRQKHHSQQRDPIHRRTIALHRLRDTEVVRRVLLRDQIEDQAHSNVLPIAVVVQPHLLLIH